ADLATSGVLAETSPQSLHLHCRTHFTVLSFPLSHTYTHTYTNTHTHTHTHTNTPPHILTHTISCIYKASITQQAGIQINPQKYTLIIIQRRNYRHSFTLTNTHTHTHTQT